MPSEETGSLESLPDSIESMIAGQIDRLAATDRTILRYASVLGTSFDPALLAAAVREDVDIDAEAWSRLGDLVQEESTGNLRFRNTLIRDAAYEGLPYRRRRDLHARVGETIEARAGVSLDEEVGALALHYFEAQRWDKAWTFCRMAGDRAMSIYANIEATKAYERALAGRSSRAGRISIRPGGPARARRGHPVRPRRAGAAAVPRIPGSASARRRIDLRSQRHGSREAGQADHDTGPLPPVPSGAWRARSRPRRGPGVRRPPIGRTCYVLVRLDRAYARVIRRGDRPGVGAARRKRAGREPTTRSHRRTHVDRRRLFRQRSRSAKVD